MRRAALVVCALVCLTTAAAAEGPADETGLAVLAQKANNPLSDVWLLITQNDYAYFDGDLVDGTRHVNSTKFQAVMPVPVK